MDENLLSVLEKKVLRKMYGPCKDVTTRERRIRKNKELKKLYQFQQSLPREDTNGYAT